MFEKPKLEAIERRTPVIDRDNHLNPEKVDNEWHLITETIRRELPTEPDLRRALVSLINVPVSETMPQRLLQSLQNIPSERIARLIDRYKRNLGTYLALEPAEGNLTRDLRHTPRLKTPGEIADMLATVYGKDDPEYEKRLQRHIESGTFLTGITVEERLLIAKRYAYARDVKLLALGAEILEQHPPLIPNQDGEIALPSGTKIVINSFEEGQYNHLLLPHLWEKREQLKDRVYEIQVDGQRFLLKERKTDRHMDTKDGGHVDGRSSSEEFSIAKEFKEKGTLAKGDVCVAWEKPISYTTYPDGFQFAVFEFEKNLLADNLQRRLSAEIIAHRAHFEAEYQVTAALAQKYKDSPGVLSLRNGNSVRGLEAALRLLRLKKEPELQLSFEEFAKVKALRMERQAYNLLQETVLALNYSNDDKDGYAFRINTTNDGVQLEIIGFDFEYYSKIPPNEALRISERRKQFEREENSRGIGFSGWNDTGEPVTRMQKAAYFAMLEAEELSDRAVE